MADIELSALAWLPARVARVRQLVLATQHHQADDADADAWLFLDLDLSVLGAAEDGYDAYSRAIRAEYDWVPDADYRAGRSKVLAGFLQRAWIYRTPALREAWEATARANLLRELNTLQAG